MLPDQFVSDGNLIDEKAELCTTMADGMSPSVDAFLSPSLFPIIYYKSANITSHKTLFTLSGHCRLISLPTASSDIVSKASQIIPVG